MAEQPTESPHQPPADLVKAEETQSTEDLACDEHGHKEEGNVKLQHSEDSDSVAEKTEDLAVESSSPGGEGVNPTPPQAHGHGDSSGDTPIREQQPRMCEEISEHHTGDETAQETCPPPTMDDREDDQLDGPKARLQEEIPDIDDTNAEASSDDGGLENGEEEAHGDAPSTNTETPQETTVEEQTDRQKVIVETIGPCPQETNEPTAPVESGGLGGSAPYLIAVCLGVVCVAVLVQQLWQLEPPPQKKDLRQVDIFLAQLEQVKSRFPSQRSELWSRSRVHLQRHLQSSQPTEPVSLILTAGLGAERTLRCLARGLASSFSTALNASVLHIDGAGRAGQDSDQVKLDIDGKLQAAFEGDQPVAVIHRLEELPPGSTLIFYRYCDHENAAYKRAFLLFTVLLGQEEHIPPESRLSAVEEMVDDHLKMKLLSAGRPVSFDRMDLDKYGGLWSRISHLILPVAAEGRIERDGC